MIEEIALPPNFCAPRGKSLPARDEVRHRRVQPEIHKKVKMVRHQHHHMHEPLLFALIKSRSLKKNRRNLRMAKLIRPTLLAADGDKENFLRRVERQWRIMRQSASANYIPVGMALRAVPRICLHWMFGTPRRYVPTDCISAAIFIASAKLRPLSGTIG